MLRLASPPPWPSGAPAFEKCRGGQRKWQQGRGTAGMGIKISGFRVWGLGFTVSGFQGLGFRV